MLNVWFAADELRQEMIESGKLQQETNHDRYRIFSR